MHELSIATAIVDEVSAAAADHEGWVRSVTVKVGALSGIVAGALEFGFEIVREGTALAHASLTIVTEPVVTWCPIGSHPVSLDSMIFRCDVHDCQTPELLSGKQIEIASFELSEDSVPTAEGLAR